MQRRTILRAGLAQAAILSAGAMLPAPFIARRAQAAPDLGHINYQLSWIRNFQFAGEYIAEDRKYFAQQGLTVDLLTGGPSIASDPIIVSGKALIGQSAPDNMANTIAHGGKLVCIGAGYQKLPYCMMSLASNPIHTPKDMIGRKIGMQTANQVIWHAFLKINKIDPAQITTVPVQFDHAPLISGEVDGFFSYSNDDVVEVKSKGHDAYYFLFDDYGYKMFTATYAVAASSLADKTKRAQILAFMKGDILGWQDAVADPALVARLTVDEYGKGLGLDRAEQEESSRMTNELMLSPATEAHGLFWMTDQAIAETIETMAAGGVKASPSMFTNEILAEIYQGKARL